VRVPDEASNGNAKVTLSFAEWTEGKVAPASFEIPVIDPELKPQDPFEVPIVEPDPNKPEKK
jgi:hypothetical protein